MSLAVLIVVIYSTGSNGITSTTIDMPDLETCQREAKRVEGFKSLRWQYAYCIDRNRVND